MLTLEDFKNMSLEQQRDWEISHSSLIRSRNATYSQCREYSCSSIVNHLTKVTVSQGEIIEIPKGTPFNFIGRVDTSMVPNNPISYYQSFINRNFVAFSTICNQNVSHYKGEFFFLHNLYAEDIVHIFPMDSDTKKDAKSEETLTVLPSLWITLSELKILTKKLGVYNQVTAKTKHNGQIFKPFAIAVFNQVNENARRVANAFGVGIVVLHPDSNAINYNKDLLYDRLKLKFVSDRMKTLYGLSVESLYYVG